MKITFVSIALLLTTLTAYAGGVDGGGGKGVVCRDAKGRIRSIELLDLWEARVLYGRTLSPSHKPLAKQVGEAIDRLKNAVENTYSHKDPRTGKSVTGADETKFQLENEALRFLKVNSAVRRLHGITLNPTPDSSEPAYPKDCQVEQVVNYISSGPAQILINQDLWEKMNSTQQAALIVHEAFYRFLRDFNETNSVRVRRAVGYVFSGNSFPPLEATLPSPHIVCENFEFHGQNSESKYYFYPDQNNKITVLAVSEFGKLAIGLYAEQTEGYLNSFDDILKGEVCKGPFGNQSMFSNSISPVDFDQPGFVHLFCDDEGKLGVYTSKVTNDLHVPTPELDQKLTCTLVQK
jgi:hypothetical protein